MVPFCACSNLIFSFQFFFFSSGAVAKNALAEAAIEDSSSMTSGDDRTLALLVLAFEEVVIGLDLSLLEAAFELTCFGIAMTSLSMVLAE